ncbi:NAD(P)-dependent oxidoreductase [Microlunatus speluncae]|uniref:NAD(P)-dependent oxidoreductase n=1 Tax=Microlunatus speluncae TaxID=2594267 RepID=UPI001266224F|nr:NAD(P)-dependent oxidoreductase [Microlunatus speluncae]
MKVLLPTSVPLDPTLPEGVQGIAYDPEAELPDEHTDAEVIVLWLNPASRMKELADRLPKLRLIQGLMAGTDSVVAAGFAPEAVIASGRGLHDLTVAEHTLALALAAARRLDRALDAQRGGSWDSELGYRQPLDNSQGLTTLRDARVTIWGFGSIAKTLAPYLTLLGAKITGVASSAGERAGYPVIAAADVHSVLPDTDILINILPAVPDTIKIIDAAVLQALPKTAWLINVGRGATVDEGALRTALIDGEIAGAALDVTATEPLPDGDPLWSAPNLIITPHTAGGRPLGADTLIEANVRALLADDPIANLVTR